MSSGTVAAMPLNTEDLEDVRREAKKMGGKNPDQESSFRLIQVAVAALSGAVALGSQFYASDVDVAQLKTRIEFLEKRIDENKAAVEKRDATLEAIQRNVYQIARKQRGVRAVRPEELE